LFRATFDDATSKRRRSRPIYILRVVLFRKTFSIIGVTNNCFVSRLPSCSESKGKDALQYEYELRSRLDSRVGWQSVFNVFIKHLTMSTVVLSRAGLLTPMAAFSELPVAGHMKTWHQPDHSQFCATPVVYSSVLGHATKFTRSLQVSFYFTSAGITTEA
jgi:hypothetical protein